MAGRKSKVQKAIEDAMHERGNINTPMDIPYRIEGKKVQLRSVRDNLIEIQESKPVEFLMQILQDGTCDYVTVDEENNLITEKVPILPKERIKIAMWLANKLIPSMQVIKVLDKDDEPPVKTGFDALVERAINKDRSN